MLRVCCLIVTLLTGPRDAEAQVALDSLSARIDPFVEKPRVLALTDIANEPDDQMSLVRLLVYSNEYDVEGLVATTSTWMRERVRPDVIYDVLDGYEQVQRNLARHHAELPHRGGVAGTGDERSDRVWDGRRGTRRGDPGRGADRTRCRPTGPAPVWISVWGGANTLAQALLHVRSKPTPAQLEEFIAKLRVYSISDQDDAGPWIRREFPALHSIVMPSTPDGDQYAYATVPATAWISAAP